MPEKPAGKIVTCPECDTTAVAVVPGSSRIVEREEEADGKVRVNCPTCEDWFFVHYRTG